jgi:hypothetical protein
MIFFACAATIADEPYRPELGKFPLAEKAKSYTGELTFVHHANRRGSFRIKGKAAFYEQAAISCNPIRDASSAQFTRGTHQTL